MNATEAQALVNSLYGSVGRSGIGQAVNQIDQGGYDYWTNQLLSGAVDPSLAQQTFSTAINQYITQNPNDPYSQYISSYQKSLLPAPAAVVPPVTAKPVAPVAAPVAKPVTVVPATTAATQPQLTVEELYRLYAGKEPDAEGLAFWKSAFGNEITPDEVASFKNSVATVKAATPTPAPAPVSGLAAAAAQPTATATSTVSAKKGKTQTATTAAPVVAPVAAPATKTTSAPVALSQPATAAPKAPVVAAPVSTAPATGGVSDAFILSWLAKNPNPTASQISALSQFGVTPDRVKALSGAAPAPVAAPVAPAVVAPTTSNPFLGMTVEDLYRMHAGKEPDAEGLAFWKNAFGPEISEAERAQFIKSVVDVQNQSSATAPSATTSTSSTTTPVAPEQSQPATNSLADLYKSVLGREASDAELASWNFGSDVDAQELDAFLGAARGEIASGGGKAGATNTLAQQILAQGTSGKWTGEGVGSAEKNAYDMAAMLAAQGLTDINQFGVRTKIVPAGYSGSSMGGSDTGAGGEFIPEHEVQEYYNKATGQAINPYYDKGGAGVWGGTFAGDGSTSYKVQFKPDGTPVFSTQYGGSSNDFANLMTDLGPVAQIALAVATAGMSLPAQLATQFAVQVLSGADPEDALKGAALSYGLSQIPGLDVVKEGTSYLNSIDPSGVLASSLTKAATSGISAAVTGQDVSNAMLSGAVSGGVSGAINAALKQPEFSGMSAAEKRLATNAMTGVLSGKPIDQVLLNTAISAARDAAKGAATQTASSAKTPAPVEDMAPTSYGTNITKQLTDAGLVDDRGQFADASSLTDADIAGIVGGDSKYSSQVQGIVSDALATIGLAQALPNPSMPGYGAALEKAGPALYKVVADAANDPEFLKKLPMLERALNAAGTSVVRILSTGSSLATYSPELGANESELLDRARKAGITLDANPAGAGRGFVNPTAPSPSTSPAPKPTPAPKPDYVVQPGDYTDTTEEVQPWQLVDPVSGLPLPSETPEPDIPEPTPEEPLVIPDAPPANDPFINPPATPEEDPFVVPELPPANDPFVEPSETPSQEPEHNPSRPVFVPTQPETWPTPAEDPLFNPYEPVTWPEVNPPPSPLPSPTPAPAPAPSPSPSPLPSPNPTPSPSPRPNPQPEPRPQPQPDPAPAPSPQPRPRPEPKPQPQPKPRPEPEPMPAPVPKPQPEPAPNPNPEPAPIPRPQPEPKPNPKPEPQPKPVPQPEPEPEVVTPPEVTPPEVKPPEVKPPEVKPPAVKVPPKVVQQVALQLGIPATSQIAQDIAEALYGTMDYLDISEEFRPSERKARPAATQKQMQQTKMAQGGYLDNLLAENMSVDDLLNLLR